MTTTLKEKLVAGQPIFGTFLSLANPFTAEIMANAGFDWLFADLEHGGGGERELIEHLLIGQAHNIPVAVRVETPARIRTGRVLDLGAEAVVFPRLDTLEQVETAIAGLAYPPRGDRGVASYNRSRGFGQPPRSFSEANDRIAGIVQIESLAALANAEKIARTDGVDSLFVGPGDLTAALGVPGQFDHPDYVQALRTIVETTTAAGIAAGILASTPEAALKYADDGFTLIAIGSDATILSAAANDTVRRIKG
ncbi:HpcH/HpaI aldolase/citrate lyase family protein (plasmid) [Arthrobacter sp. UC242_113]|uniref:HpcH/HpaI aldolase family protein n=1 Tax=Arthrobacter sp. UC242_113 TaxID=3374550 RepID=UPI003756EFF5